MTGPAARAEAASGTTVRMGELAVGNAETQLKTLLGSCVGLVLYDRAVGVGGLAHIVLPSSRGHEGPAAKFVDTAIPELIESLGRLGGRERSLCAKLAGGASMFSTQAASSIGDQNVQVMKEELSRRSIPVAAEHCGGTQGRRMTFWPATGRVLIEVVGSESVEI